MARSSVEPESGITVVLSTMEPLAPGFRRQLRQVIADARGTVLPENFVLNKNDTVRIYVMLEAPMPLKASRILASREIRRANV